MHETCSFSHKATVTAKMSLFNWNCGLMNWDCCKKWSCSWIYLWPTINFEWVVSQNADYRFLEDIERRTRQAVEEQSGWRRGWQDRQHVCISLSACCCVSVRICMCVSLSLCLSSLCFHVLLLVIAFTCHCDVIFVMISIHISDVTFKVSDVFLCTGWPQNLAQFLCALILSNISWFIKLFHCHFFVCSLGW